MSDHPRPIDDPRALEHAVATAATALRVGTPEHPSPRQLGLYHRGELPATETEPLQDHLALCPECAELLLDLADFGSLATESDSQEWSARANDVWQAIETSIGDDRDRGAFPGPPAQAWRRAPLAAAALLTLAAGLGSWMLLASRGEELAAARRQLAETTEQLALAGERIAALEEGSLETPQLVVPSHSLFPPSFLRQGTSAKKLVLPPGAHFFLLELHTIETASQGDHHLRVLDSEGVEVWAGSGLWRTPAGSFRLALPRRLLASGRYRLELRAPGENAARPLAEYVLELEHR